MYLKDKLLYGFTKTLARTIFITIMLIISLILSGIALALIKTGVGIISGLLLAVLSYAVLFITAIIAQILLIRQKLNGEYRFLKNIRSVWYLIFKTVVLDGFAVFYIPFVSTFTETNMLEY